MKQKSANQKSSQRDTQDVEQTPSAGSNGIAITPPAYGIDSLDGALAQISPLLAQRKIQAKLSVGPAGDQYEQEADRVAAQVMTASLTQPVQRVPEDKAELQSKALTHRAGASFEAGTDFEDRLAVARGSGTPLPKSTRDFMEQRMGADFSGVKVHKDAQSHQLNQAIRAKAFTTGQDVFFRQGAYQPSSESGKELIAHELTHVVQQTAGQAVTVQRKVVGDDGKQITWKDVEPIFIVDKRFDMLNSWLPVIRRFHAEQENVAHISIAKFLNQIALDIPALNRIALDIQQAAAVVPVHAAPIPAAAPVRATPVPAAAQSQVGPRPRRSGVAEDKKRQSDILPAQQMIYCEQWAERLTNGNLTWKQYVGFVKQYNLDYSLALSAVKRKIENQKWAEALARQNKSSVPKWLKDALGDVGAMLLDEIITSLMGALVG